MNKKITVSVALAITLIAMTVTFAITWLASLQRFDSTMKSVTQMQAQYTKLAEIDNYARKNFYGSINDDQLFDRIAAGYIAGLGDRYSVYYTTAEYAEMVAVENGRLLGVGIEVVREASGNYRVARVFADSPAARAGVEKGATIASVNGQAVSAFSGLAQLRSALLGEEGTELVLGCTYSFAGETTHTIRRVNYTAPTVESFYLGGYAYVRFYSVGQNTFTDFDYIIRQALGEEVKGFVFDVRGIHTTQYRQVYSMIDLLCPRGTIAKRENLNGTLSVLATSDENMVDLPMVVLVDGGTGAAAELFAAGLRDLNGAQLVGLRTTGHGTLQSTPYRLSDGSAVSITEAKILTGRDESYDQAGLAPNVEVLGDQVTAAMLVDPVPAQDPQILRAFEVIRLMVRERGGDPGTGMAPPASSAPETGDSQAASGTADSLPEDSAPPEEDAG